MLTGPITTARTGKSNVVSLTLSTFILHSLGFRWCLNGFNAASLIKAAKWWKRLWLPDTQ